MLSDNLVINANGVPKLQIEHIEEFLALSKSLNFTTTAKQFFIAQSTLSQHIASIEKEIGFPLIDHDKTPQLTDAGFVFSVKAAEVVDAYKTAIEAARNTASSSLQRIRVLDYRSSLGLTDVFNDLWGQYQNDNLNFAFVALESVERYTEFELLDANKIDVAFTFTPENELSFPFEVNIDSYEFLPLGIIDNVLQTSSISSTSKQGYFTAKQLNKYLIVGTDARLYATCNNAESEKLRSVAPNVKIINAPQGAKNRMVLADEHAMGIYFKLPARIVEKHSPEFTFLSAKDFDFTIQAYAVRRKDSPNLHVAELFSHWREYLGGAKPTL